MRGDGGLIVPSARGPASPVRESPTSRPAYRGAATRAGESDSLGGEVVVRRASLSGLGEERLPFER
jgi:hypothetical protein